MKVAVTGGKGGVGKTFVSIKLAYWFKEKGYKVGLADFDFSTGNLPDELEPLDSEMSVEEGYIKPAKKDGIEIISHSLVMKDSPVMLDSEERVKTLADYLEGTKWNADVLIIDTPPAIVDEMKLASRTSDVSIVVTTAAKTSILDAKRCIKALALMNVPPIGVVVNMPYYKYGDKLLPLFVGKDGVPEEILGVPVLAVIPFNGFELSLLDRVGEQILKYVEKREEGDEEVMKRES